MTPQELMDISGAGNATKQLVKQGDWDEWNGLPYRNYIVEVEYQYAETGTKHIAVKARSKEEAGQLAYDENERDLDVLDISTEIVGVEERNEIHN